MVPEAPAVYCKENTPENSKISEWKATCQPEGLSRAFYLYAAKAQLLSGIGVRTEAEKFLCREHHAGEDRFGKTLDVA